jgi:hypothetical protein
MIKKSLKIACAIFTLLSFSLLLTSCDISDDSNSIPDSTDSAMLKTYKTVTKKINKSQRLSPTNKTGSTTSVSFLFSSLYADALDPHYTVTTNISVRNPELSTENISIKSYLDTQFDPNSANSNGAATNMMGRMNNALQLFCGIGIAIADVDAEGYPTNGDHTFSLTPTLATHFESECGISFSGDSAAMLGSTLTVNVTEASDITLFDKAISVEMEANPSTFNYYLRYSADEINVATSEKNISGSNAGHEYRTSILYDIDDSNLRAEYLSVPADNTSSESVYVYRLFMDSTTTHVMVYESGSDTDYIVYSGAGITNDLTSTCAVSFGISDNANESGSTYSDLNGCINRSLGTITSTTDTLSCDTSLDSASQASSDIETLVAPVISAKTTAGWNVIDLTNANISFTNAATMFSASITTP